MPLGDNYFSLCFFFPVYIFFRKILAIEDSNDAMMGFICPVKYGYYFSVAYVIISSILLSNFP